MNRLQRVVADHEPLHPLYPVTRVLPRTALETEDLLAEARTVFESAKEDAARIIAEARSEAARLREQVASETEELRRVAREEATKEATEEFQGLLQSMAAFHDQLRSQAEVRIVEAALAFAGAIMRVELKAHPERLEPWVREALASARRDSDVCLFLHPADAASLSDEIGKAKEMQGVRIVEDAQLPRFTVRVEAAGGIYDASLDQRLAALEAHLRGTIEKGETHG